MEKTVRVPLNELDTFAGRCKYLYKIQNKNGELIPFEFFEAQRQFNEIVESEFERTKKEFGSSQCRVIALKPRQVGWTTYSNIRSLDMQLHDEGSNGVIVAHDKETTELVYMIYIRAYENLPDYVIPTLQGEDMSKRQYFREVADPEKLKGVDLSGSEFDETMHIQIKPQTTSQSGKRLGFKDPESLTSIFTAGKGELGGLGGTLRRIHMTEIGSYDHYSGLLTSLNPSVPKFADGVFYIQESTANGTTGRGEGFYKAWNRNVKEWQEYQKGERQRFTGFRPVFIPWYMFSEYELPLAGGKYESLEGVDFGSEEAEQEFLSREKELLEDGIWNPLTKQTQVLTPEKINWYRWIIKEDCEYDYNEAMKFYPTTPEDAFVASSYCFFDSIKLTETKNRYINGEAPDYETGDLIWSDENELEFRPSSVGSLRIFEYPVSDYTNRYVIGADIALGREDGDYSVAYVKDRLTQEYVAMWFGKKDQDVFAQVLLELGHYYNEALIVPESNLSTVVEIIKPDGITPYVGEIYYDDTTSQVKWGYWTSGPSRQILIDFHKAWLRENGYNKLPDLETIDEHLSFIRHQTRTGTKYEAAEDSHDDRVIAAGLCNIGDEWWEETPKEYKPSKIKEIITRARPNHKKYIRNAKLGRKKG